MSFLEEQRQSLRQFLSKVDFADIIAESLIENGCSSLAVMKMMSLEELNAIVDDEATKESLARGIQSEILMLGTTAADQQQGAMLDEEDDAGEELSRATDSDSETHSPVKRNTLHVSTARGRPRSISTHLAAHGNPTRRRASSVTSVDSVTEIYSMLHKQYPNMRKKFASRGDVEIYKGIAHDSRWIHDDSVPRGILLLLKDEVSKEYFVVVCSRRATQVESTGSPSTEELRLHAVQSTSFIYPIYGKFEMQGKEKDPFMRKFIAMETQRNTHFIGLHFLGNSTGGSNSSSIHPNNDSATSSIYSQVDSIIARKDAKDFVTTLMSCLNINQVELYQSFSKIKYNIPGGDPSETIQDWMEPVLKGHGFHYNSIPKVWRKFLLEECKLTREMLDDPKEAKKILKVLMDEMKDIQKNSRRLSLNLEDGDAHNSSSRTETQPVSSGSTNTPETTQRHSYHKRYSAQFPSHTELAQQQQRHVYTSQPTRSNKKRSASMSSTHLPRVSIQDSSPGDYSPSQVSSSYEASMWEDLPEDFDVNDDGTPLPPSSPTTPSTTGSLASSSGGAFPPNSGSTSRSTPISVRGRGRSLHELASPLISSPLVSSLKADSPSVPFSSSTLMSRTANSPEQHTLSAIHVEDDSSATSSDAASSPGSSLGMGQSPPAAPSLAGLHYIQRVHRGLLHSQHRKSMSHVLQELANTERSYILKSPIEEKAEEFYSELLKRGIHNQGGETDEG